MNTSDHTKSTGRRNNYHEMRSVHHDIPRPFTIRTAGKDLSKTWSEKTWIKWTEEYHPGNGHTI